MTSPRDLRIAPYPSEKLEVRQVKISCPAFNRWLYETVGRDWNWTERLVWSNQQWADYASRAELETWVGYCSGTPVGYFELEQQDNEIEIVSFGLLPPFIGQGIGGWLLSRAVERAWERDAARVWLHTCSDDHPNALANYQKRGFRVFRVKQREQD